MVEDKCIEHRSCPADFSLPLHGELQQHRERLALSPFAMVLSSPGGAGNLNSQFPSHTPKQGLF